MRLKIGAALPAEPGQHRREDMRYSFHGKRRGTHESIDGYIEASSAIDAIDQLAGRGRDHRGSIPFAKSLPAAPNDPSSSRAISNKPSKKPPAPTPPPLPT